MATAITDVSKNTQMNSLSENSQCNAEKIDSLSFVRLKIPRIIPIDLITNVKGRTFTPEQFYRYQESQIDNPYNHLYVLVDDAKKIHGYLWAEVNVLDNSLFVNTFSVNKKYWGKGKAMPVAMRFVANLREKTKSPRVFWITCNIKFFEKHGFHTSKQVLMEYND